MTIRVMLAGQRRRGKDTLAQQLVSLVPGIHRLAVADALKREVADALAYSLHGGRDGGSCLLKATIRRREQYGPLWQWWGQWRRDVSGEDYWIRQVAAEVAGTERWLGHPADWLITDCRYPNEAAWGQAHGFLLVRITGPYRGASTDQRDDSHPSERYIEELHADLEYANTGSVEAMQDWVATQLLPACQSQEAWTHVPV